VGRWNGRGQALDAGVALGRFQQVLGDLVALQDHWNGSHRLERVHQRRFVLVQTGASIPFLGICFFFGSG